MTPATDDQKSGMLRKRGSRMRNWSSRFMTLSGPKLSYKVKADSPNIKGAFDLAPGCIVTEVLEDSMGIKGKKLFSFWIVWPHDKQEKINDEKGVTPTEDSDEDDHKEDSARNLKQIVQSDMMVQKKDLKQIVHTEMMEHKLQQQKVEEEIERHHKYDHNISLGMKVAALAVGGVVVGALTAGVGLVPYITVVGISAVAGGGAVALQFRRPSDSRLILACDTMQEASEWKIAIEKQISKLEDHRRPMLPPSADPYVISSIIGMSTAGGGWKCVSTCEGIRILEQTNPAAGTCCRKAQIVVQSTPVQIVKSLDDHADLIGVTFRNQYKVWGGKSHVMRRMCLSRFWKLDDDGIYLITLNLAKDPDFNTSWDEDVGGKYSKRKRKQTIKNDSYEADRKMNGNGGDHNSNESMKRNGSASSFTTSPTRDTVSPAISPDKPLSTSISTSSSPVPHTKTQKVDIEDSASPQSRDAASSCTQPSIDAVITVSPRKDHADYEEDLSEAMITVTCQASTTGWLSGELDLFLNQFLQDHLTELKQYLLYSRCGMEDKGMATDPIPKDLQEPFSEEIEAQSRSMGGSLQGTVLGIDLSEIRESRAGSLASPTDILRKDQGSDKEAGKEGGSSVEEVMKERDTVGKLEIREKRVDNNEKEYAESLESREGSRDLIPDADNGSFSARFRRLRSVSPSSQSRLPSTVTASTGHSLPLHHISPPSHHNPQSQVQQNANFKSSVLPQQQLHFNDHTAGMGDLGPDMIPEPVVVHRSGARSLMRRLGGSRDQVAKGVTTSQPGGRGLEGGYGNQQQIHQEINPMISSPSYPLLSNAQASLPPPPSHPPSHLSSQSTWRSSPGSSISTSTSKVHASNSSSTMDANQNPGISHNYSGTQAQNMTDQQLPGNNHHSQYMAFMSNQSNLNSTSGLSTDQPSVATKRKISLRKSLINLSPFSHSPTTAAAANAIHPQASVTTPTGTTAGFFHSLEIPNIIASPRNSPTVMGSSSNNSPISRRTETLSQSGPGSGTGIGIGHLNQNTSVQLSASGGVIAPPHLTTSTLSSSSSSGAGVGVGVGGISAVAVGGGGIGTVSVGKRRSKNVNSEASSLRGQIAAKEYEVQRITKDLERKRDKEKKLELSSNNHVIARSDSKPKSNDTAIQQHQQSYELDKLKGQYFDLTGTPYEQSNRRRGPLGRLRVFGGTGIGGSRERTGSTSSNPDKNNDINNGSEMTRSTALLANGAHVLNSSSIDATELGRGQGQGHGQGQGQRLSSSQSLAWKRGGSNKISPRDPNVAAVDQFKGRRGVTCRMPPHWQHTQRNEGAESHYYNPEEDGRTNIIVVSMFLLCMTSTIFLAKILSYL